jgi:hypothetical protein
MTGFKGSNSHHGVSGRTNPAAVWRAYQAYHMDKHGWDDIGYSGGYDDNGVLYEGRWLDTAGGHTYGFNMDSYGWCFIGDSSQGVSDKAKRALFCLMRIAEKHHGREGYTRDHRDAGAISGSGTSCPGPGLYGVAAAMPRGAAPPIPVPPGGDLTVNKPVLMRNKTTGTISLFYTDTPWRYDCRPKDVDTYRFFGVEYKGDEDPWFWEVTEPIKAVYK